MNALKSSLLLATHGLLLLAACTRLTVFSWLWERPWSFTINQYVVSWRGGWSYRPYVSDYSLWLVLLYIVAYAVGIVAFWTLLSQRMPRVALLGLLVSTVGGVSFAFEATHWLVFHHKSLLVSLPIVSLALVCAAIARFAYRAIAWRITAQQPAAAPWS